MKFYLLVGLTVMDNSWFNTRMVLDVVVCAGCLKPKMVKSHVLLNRKKVSSSFNSVQKKALHLF